MHPWQYSQSGWLAHIGVHEPDVMSPAQRGMLSAREAQAYDRRCADQRRFVYDAKTDWELSVLGAHKAGQIDETASDDARRFIARVEALRADLARQDAADAARYETVPLADIRVGDTLKHPLGRLTVLKKNRVSLQVAHVGSTTGMLVRNTHFTRERTGELP